MTIIAVKHRTMAADSWCFRGSSGGPLPDGQHKIIRVPGGGLVGACGGALDIYRLHQWVRGGMDCDNQPRFLFPAEHDQSIDWLWLRLDGTLWRGDASLATHPVTAPGAIGISEAAVFAEGAMAAGASVEVAVRLATERCVYVGGPVQVEHL